MSTHDNINVEEIENLDFKKYEDKYSESGLWDKIRKNIAKIGVKVIYQALLLYYVAQSPNCPAKIKAGIIGALGYLISPIDLIPDIMPGIGYADDAAAIATAVALAQIYITDEIKAQAKAKLADLLGEDVIEHETCLRASKFLKWTRPVLLPPYTVTIDRRKPQVWYRDEGGFS